jgi:hypothetical protein
MTSPARAIRTQAAPGEHGGYALLRRLIVGAVLTLPPLLVLYGCAACLLLSFSSSAFVSDAEPSVSVPLLILLSPALLLLTLRVAEKQVALTREIREQLDEQAQPRSLCPANRWEQPCEVMPAPRPCGRGDEVASPAAGTGSRPVRSGCARRRARRSRARRG